MKAKLGILIIGLIALDQIIKAIMIDVLSSGEINVIGDFFTLKYVENYGISFSMFDGRVSLILIVSVLAMLGIAYVLVDAINTHKPKLAISLSVMLAGALGNFIDRAYHGFVVDYLAFDFGFYQFPVFNLADMFLVLSCVFVIIYVYFEEKDEDAKNSN